MTHGTAVGTRRAGEPPVLATAPSRLDVKVWEILEEQVEPKEGDCSGASDKRVSVGLRGLDPKGPPRRRAARLRRRTTRSLGPACCRRAASSSAGAAALTRGRDRGKHPFLERNLLALPGIQAPVCACRWAGHAQGHNHPLSRSKGRRAHHRAFVRQTERWGGRLQPARTPVWALAIVRWWGRGCVWAGGA